MLFLYCCVPVKYFLVTILWEVQVGYAVSIMIVVLLFALAHYAIAQSMCCVISRRHIIAQYPAVWNHLIFAINRRYYSSNVFHCWNAEQIIYCRRLTDLPWTIVDFNVNCGHVVMVKQII